MTLQVNATKFNSHGRPFKIHFNNTVDPACSVSYNSTDNLIGDQLQIHASFNSCEIFKTELSNGNFIYNQTVLLTYGENPASQLIYREEVITFNVECTRLSNSTVFLESQGHLNVTRLAKQIFSKGKLFLKFAFYWILSFKKTFRAWMNYLVLVRHHQASKSKFIMHTS